MPRANAGQVDPRLAANLQRARLLPTSGRYLFVNSATAQLMLVDNGTVVDQMRVVVGTPQTPTVPMASKIYFATLNPYWNVAEDLVRKIVAPRVVSQGLGYLKKSNYEAVDKYGEGATVIPASSIDWKAVLAGTEQVKMRQKPGKTNSMGIMKVPFANDYGIFLHDTFNKPQFAESARANSNGCIRLEDAPRFARWLFGDRTRRSPRAQSPTKAPACPTPIAIYVAYLTAEPTGRGVAICQGRLFARPGGCGDERRGQSLTLAALAWHLRRASPKGRPCISLTRPRSSSVRAPVAPAPSASGVKNISNMAAPTAARAARAATSCSKPSPASTR